MGYSGSTYLASKDYCGFILLLNTATEENEKNNCESKRIVVEDALRILVFTSEHIRKDEQLFLSYGDGFGFEGQKKPGQ